VRIVKTKKFKQCRDGTIMNEFLLDEQVTTAFLEYCKHFGEVKLLVNLDPPFYSFIKDPFFTIKGLIDDRSMHVKFTRDQVEPAKVVLQILIDSYAQDNVTISDLKKRLCEADN
jgi:hypothetical protein